MSKALADYRDSKGFIGHKHYTLGLEFGDGTQRLGTYYIARYTQVKHNRVQDAEALLEQVKLVRREVEDSIEYVRHWDDNYWPGQLGIMSKDNLEPLLMAMGLFSPYSRELRELTNELLFTLWKRGGLLWNTKHIWPKPEDKPKRPDWYILWLNLANHTIRINEWKILWPVLWVLDLQHVFSSLMRVGKSYFKPDDVGDDLNHQNNLVFDQIKLPTPTIKLARWIYRFRFNAGLDKDNRLTGFGPETAYKWYYRGQNAPPMDKVWKLTLDRYIK